ncbi:hypothetical protein Rhal01_03591 [Rubritalea halochordaticola]|uniref:Uncharacterized protein n=1 Tax=Rubritalea halochordaticola TaxID=714537 RepID=A0ABP9V402_9BACT
MKRVPSLSCCILQILVGLLTILNCYTVNAESSGREQAHIELSILSVGGGDVPEKLHWLDASGKLAKDSGSSLLVSTSTILAPVKYTGPKILTICVPDESEAGFKVLSKLKLPEDSSKLVVVLVPNRKADNEAQSYRALALPSDQARFSGGTRMVLNFTSTRLRGVIGKTPFDPNAKSNKFFYVDANASKFISEVDSHAKAGDGYQVYLEYYDQTDKKWVRFVTSRWFHNPSKKKYLFVYQTRHNNSPELKVVSEKIKPAQVE